MAKFDLKAYARQGAAARVAELNEELGAIYRTFPDLRGGAKASAGGSRGSEIGNGRKRTRESVVE